MFCKITQIESDDEFNIERCITHLDELIVEFERRFEDVKLIRPQINLFNNRMAGEKMFHYNWKYMSFKQFHFYLQKRLTCAIEKKLFIYS